ncbi:hypothetical protein YB2330_000312 [Saitoella coloradoensis]
MDTDTDTLAHHQEDPSPTHEPDDCTICLQPINLTTQALVSHCYHTFDLTCLQQWLQISRRCPLCNGNVSYILHAITEEGSYEKIVLPSLADEKGQPGLGLEARAWIRDRFAQGRNRMRSRRGMERRVNEQVMSTSPLSPSAIARRRFVYTNHLRSAHIASNAHTRFRPDADITTEKFRGSNEMQNRARVFLRREVLAFGFWRTRTSAGAGAGAGAEDGEGDARYREFLVEYIISVLKNVGILTPAARRLIGEFLDAGSEDTESVDANTNTSILLHELRTWLRSPFQGLEGWDRSPLIQYDLPLPPLEGGDEWTRVRYEDDDGEAGDEREVEGEEDEIEMELPERDVNVKKMDLTTLRYRLQVPRHYKSKLENTDYCRSFRTRDAKRWCYRLLKRMLNFDTSQTCATDGPGIAKERMAKNTITRKRKMDRKLIPWKKLATKLDKISEKTVTRVDDPGVLPKSAMKKLKELYKVIAKARREEARETTNAEPVRLTLDASSLPTTTVCILTGGVPTRSNKVYGKVKCRLVTTNGRMRVSVKDWSSSGADSEPQCPGQNYYDRRMSKKGRKERLVIDASRATGSDWGD